MRQRFAHALERLLRAGGAHRGMSRLLDVVCDELLNVRLVFYDQYGCHWESCV
jgi:hypothetical protein